MTNDQFEREMNYRVAVHLAKAMLRDGLIDESEYHAIDTMLCEKFRPVIGILRG